MRRGKFLLPVIGMTFFSISINAQNLYMSRDVKRAYKNGTRAMDGKPGKKYWQNHGRYTITITAAPPDRTVKGRETITYINNSPDTLRNPSIKLLLNIHKPGAPREYGTVPDYLTSVSYTHLTLPT